MVTPQNISPWSRLIELAVLFSLGALLLALYSHGHLDRILDNTLSVWFFGIILTILVVVEGFALAFREVDVHFWSWLTTGLGMLGTVLGFSLALAGIDVSALHEPKTLSAEIGEFLKAVAFAIDTTLMGLSAAMVMESMNKIRQILSMRRVAPNTAEQEE